MATDPFTAKAYKIRTGLPCLKLSFRDLARGRLPGADDVIDYDEDDKSGDEEDDDESEEDDGQHVKPRERKRPTESSATDVVGTKTEEKQFDLIIVSFALHLVESPSDARKATRRYNNVGGAQGSDGELFAVLWALSLRAKWLVIIGPHKRPHIKPQWGWTRYDLTNWTPADHAIYANAVGEDEDVGLEVVQDRVRGRIYRSSNLL